MNISGIYQIQSKRSPDKIYIGSAVNIKIRWYRHINNLKLGKHHSPILQAHYNKYGIADICFVILEFCNRDMLLEREQYYMDIYNPYFNIAKKAGHPTLGRKMSVETKEKHRKNMIGNKHSLGLIQSDEHKRKRIEKLMGCKRSMETNIKHSNTNKLLGIKPPSRLGMKKK